MLRVARDEAEQEVAPATDHVALPHFRPGRHHTLEGGEHRFLLRLQPHQGEEGDLPAQHLRVEIGMIAADHALFLQPPHAAQAGGGRQADAPGQFDIRHAAVSLELRKNLTVHAIQVGFINASHRGFPAIPEAMLVKT